MKALSTSDVIKLFTPVKIPADLRFASDRYKNYAQLKTVIDHIDDYNEHREEGDIYLAIEHLMKGMRELISYSEGQFTQYHKVLIDKQLEIKKKDHIIDGLKSFNDFRREQESPKKKPKLKRRSPPKETSDDQPSEREIRRLMKMV